jgi:hypothetical protein
MAEKEKIVIFHLYRNDGSALFLHPFDSKEKLISRLDRADVEGRYGQEPRVESLTLFRNSLYRMIEEGVKEWVGEARFIPRFLLSAGLFLVAYFFLSFVIRDPLPVFDELIISLVGSIVFYIFLGKRDLQSDMALRKRVALRTTVDRISFQESAFVKEVESILHRTELESPEEILAHIMDPPDRSFTKEEEAEARELMAYLESRFNSKDFRRQEKLVNRLTQSNNQAQARETIRKWADSKKVDLSLFAVYTRMKKSIENVN